MEILSTVNYLRSIILGCLYQIRLVPVRTAVDLAHQVYGPSPGKGGTPIVVLHGLLGSKKNWAGMCKRISSGTNKTVVAADVRNHGQSPHASTHTYVELASDVSQLIDKLSLKKAIVMGHSMGGRTAMVLGLTEPAKVASLVIVDISPISTPGNLSDFMPRLLNTMNSIEFSGQDLSKAKALVKEKIKASGLSDDEGFLGFVVMNVGTKPDNTVGWLLNIPTLAQHFQDITTFPNMSGKKYDGPTIFIGGDQSHYIPPNDINGIRELFPKAELKYVNGVGHNVHAEDPNTFYSMVIEFLKDK